MKKLALIVLLLIFIPVFVPAEETLPPTTVVLVRHSEKSATPPDDPGLSEAGLARTGELIRVLGAAEIHAVYSSQFARTRLTAEAVAGKFSVPVQQVDAARTDELVKDVLTKQKGKTVLIVGHSNTLPEIIRAFGGPSIEDPEDHEYDNLLILFVYSPGQASLVRLKFGAPS